jgi:primosomal protein N' (replication factor Y) (superfamily II helicase)
MYAEIVFPLPFRNTFTYLIPEDLVDMCKVGVRTVVPFGKRILTGFVINVTEQTSVKEKIKPIHDVLDYNPIFTSESLKFYEWISDYYLSSLGEALRNAVPYGLDIETRKKIVSDKNYCKEILPKEPNQKSIKAKLLSVLSEREVTNLNYLQKELKKKNIYSALRELEKLGAITILSELGKAKVGIKKVKFVKLAKAIDEIYEFIPEIESRSPKQVVIILELINLKNQPVALSELLKKTKSSQSSVDSLAEKGIVEVFDKEIERTYQETYSEEKKHLKLTEQQQKIVDEVKTKFNPFEFSSYLLYGVTGSGKTQVYIELSKKVLEYGKTVLILVPEISLTPQITSRLYNNFGNQIAVVHSRMSLGERYDTWRKIISNDYKIVVGARSALFSPLQNIGLIVVDEEHDSSYKQQDFLPKYNARDAALVRAKIANCPIVLGSATPSIESMYNAKSGKYQILELKERVDNAKLPEIKLVNVLIEKKKKKMENIFSKLLLDEITVRLQRKEGVIILQNRRGFATNVYCEDCGEIETCKDCSVPMIYHINKNSLQCHYCGYMKPVPKACSNCGSLSLRYFGTGTQRVEDELAYYFPTAKIERIDSDSVTKKGELGMLLNRFRKGEIDILVGTQMVSKGLDFSNVTLVGVISAETSLWLPDFRADERTYQLLTQVAGRSGRSKAAGEVLIQTQNEKHFVLQKVLTQDYEGFYSKEIMLRQQLGFPPFTRICLIESKDENEDYAKGAISDFYNFLLQYKKGLRITPPSPAIIARLKKNYRFHILIKSNRKIDPGGSYLRNAVLNSFILYNQKSRYRNIRLYFDIDPQSIL